MGWIEAKDAPSGHLGFLQVAVDGCGKWIAKKCTGGQWWSADGILLYGSIPSDPLVWHPLIQPEPYVPPEVWNDPKVSLPGIGVKVRWKVQETSWVKARDEVGFIDEGGGVMVGNCRHIISSMKGWLPLKEDGPC